MIDVNDLINSCGTTCFKYYLEGKQVCYFCNSKTDVKVVLYNPPNNNKIKWPNVIATKCNNCSPKHCEILDEKDMFTFQLFSNKIDYGKTTIYWEG